MRRRGRHPEADDRSEEQAIIVGFDAEWVDASHEDHDLPPDTSNRILSWQLFLLNPNTGRSCGIFVEPKSGHKASRKLLTTLIGQVISKALKEGVLDRIPSRIILAAHFSRADLSTLRDFVSLKRKVDAVRTTYATTTKPLFVRIPTDQGEAPASVRIVDTMLLSPGRSGLAALGEALGLPKVELPRRLLERAHGPFPRSRSRQLHHLCDDRCGDRCPVDGPGAQNRARRDGCSSALSNARRRRRADAAPRDRSGGPGCQRV